jgi:DNA-binding MarR family transcriptional regulator
MSAVTPTAASGDPSGAARDERAIEAWRRIRSISGNAVTLAGEHRFMRESGLTGGPMRALRCLPLDEPLSMRRLATLMGCDNSYVTPLVDSLERRGLANRQAHPTDRRVKVIALTEEGRRLAERAQREYATPPPAFSALSPSELGTLCELLSRIDSAGD